MGTDTLEPCAGKDLSLADAIFRGVMGPFATVDEAPTVLSSIYFVRAIGPSPGAVFLPSGVGVLRSQRDPSLDRD